MLNKIPTFAKLSMLSFMLISAGVIGYNCFTSVKAENSLVLGEKVYKANCAGCHMNGLNVIKKDKPVIGSSKIKSKDVLKEFLNNPPAPMPKYTALTSDVTQLDALYTYLNTLK